MRLGTNTSPLLAGGQPISEQVAIEAADWFTLLMEGKAGDDELARWKQWRQAAPDHERAWLHMEAVSRRLQGLDGASRRALADPTLHSRSRRKSMQALFWFGMSGGMALFGSRTTLWQQTVADYRTSTGERREIALADGTHLLLNTGSAVNIRFTSQQREVELITGEIMVTTGHAQADGQAETRPFFVRSAEGRMQALGTRFVVHQQEDVTHIAVLDSRVRIATRDGAQSLILNAGEQTVFTRKAIEMPEQASEQAEAWSRGQLIADDMCLADFLAELSRYRPGFVRCDPAVADLRFSAVFPLNDTDRILTMLTTSLPVRVHWRSRYWVNVEPWS